MMLTMAMRSVSRNRWRTALTVSGIAVGVALVIWMGHVTASFKRVMVDSMTYTEIGDLQLVPSTPNARPGLFDTLRVDADLQGTLMAVHGVAGVSPRIRTTGLLGNETQSTIALIMGVDPEQEKTVTTTSERVVNGRWIGASRPDDSTQEAVLGANLAQQLGATLGDELVLLAQAVDGSLGNDLIKVVGIAKTHNSKLDRSAVWVGLDTARRLTALDQAVHEVVLRLKDRRELDDTVLALEAHLLETPATITRWSDKLAFIIGMIERETKILGVVYFFIYLVAGLGVLNTQRMSALEREREFGVLLAIGTTPSVLARQILIESGLIALIGAFLGAALGFLWVYYNTKYGISLGGEFTYQGVLLDEILLRFEPRLALNPVIGLITVGIISGVWPALASAKLNPVAAISGRR